MKKIAAVFAAAVVLWFVVSAIVSIDAPERDAQIEDAVVSGGRTDGDTTLFGPDGAPQRSAVVEDEDDRLRVVSALDGALVRGARVRCVGASGARAELDAPSGSFERPETLPAALEVSADGHATRWVLVRSEDANQILLWPAAALVVTAVDEVGRPVGGVEFGIEREAREPAIAHLFEGVFDAPSDVGPGGTWPAAFDALDEDVYSTWIAPRAERSFGPRAAERRHSTPNHGRVRIEGLPSGEWWRVVDARSSIVRFEPPHVPDPNGVERRPAAAKSLSGWVRSDVAPDAHIVLVRHGTCVVRFAFDVASDRAVSNVEIARVDIRPLEPAGADPVLIAAGFDAPGLDWLGSPTGADDPRGSYVVERGGFRAGPHRLTAHWRLDKGPDGRPLEHVENRYAVREFTLSDGEYLDLGLLKADPGWLEIVITTVDESGTPLGGGLDLRHVYRDESGALAESSSELRVDVELELERLLYFESELLDLTSGHARLDIAGLADRAGTVRVQAREVARKPPSNILVERSTEVQFPSAVARRVDVPLRVSRARRIEFGLLVDGRRHSVVPLASASAITTDEVQGRSVALEWSALDGHALGTAIVPFGAARATLAFRDAAPALVAGESSAELGAWYFVDAAFEVDASTAELLLLEATRAARATLVCSVAHDTRTVENARWQYRATSALGSAWFDLGWFGDGRTARLDERHFVVDGLPADAVVRAEALGLEFRTGPPGSNVEVELSAVK